MTDLLRLPTFAADAAVHAVIETPRHAPAKFKYEPKLGCFVLSRTLTAGLSYPYNWGFIPSTRGDDGDPLDVLVICDVTVFAGLVMRCEAIGVLEVQQTEKGRTLRNDRLFLVPVEGCNDRDCHDVRDMSAGFRQELEHFFVAAVANTGKKLKMLGWQGPKRARRLIETGARKFQQQAAPGSAR
jgi:inorganic pyrophosphatase